MSKNPMIKTVILMIGAGSNDPPGGEDQQEEHISELKDLKSKFGKRKLRPQRSGKE